MLSVTWRVLFGALLLTVIEMIVGAAQMALAPSTLPQTVPGAMPWWIASNLLNVAVLTWIALSTNDRGWRLGLALCAIFYGIGQFSSLIEALFFGLMGASQTIALMVAVLIKTVVFIPLYLAMLSPVLRQQNELADTRRRLTPMRLITGAAAYVVVYFVAGMIIFPFVADFYATKRMPSLPQVVAVGLFIRGPLFVLLAYLIVRMTAGTRADRMVMLGAALSILGGVAPLIVPNAFFPDEVRWVHFFEVTISNFVYGAFLGWLLTTRRAPQLIEHPAAA